VSEVSKDLDDGFFGLLIEAHDFLVEAELFKEPENGNLLVGFCVSVVVLEVGNKVEDFRSKLLKVYGVFFLVGILLELDGKR
jgi:hypothetical protein